MEFIFDGEQNMIIEIMIVIVGQGLICAIFGFTTQAVISNRGYHKIGFGGDFSSVL
ncbi:hypothetical protein RFF05_03785 [Bengtsoniella intestinalis]|uniref:hypothetical protein n=1 Tax=Bengtsoniella intestinalis TaxID=3073143 RepID=UPI00391F9ADE